MRRLFQLSTTAFWLIVLALWAAATWMPVPQRESHSRSAERSYSLDEVARHAGADDCWMAIAGAVYNLTSYLQHPSDPAVVTPWCGKEATDAYRTTTKGRPHSPYADSLLPRDRIGVLRDS